MPCSICAESIFMVPPPPCTHACLLNLGFEKGWVLGMPLFPKSTCRSYVSSVSSSTKLSPRTKIGRIQTYSCTLNFESWIRGVFNRIRLNTERCGLTIAFCIFEPVVVLWIVVVLCSIDTADIARALRRLITDTALRGNISTMLCMCLTLSGNISLIIQL